MWSNTSYIIFLNSRRLYSQIFLVVWQDYWWLIFLILKTASPPPTWASSPLFPLFIPSLLQLVYKQVTDITVNVVPTGKGSCFSFPTERHISFWNSKQSLSPSPHSWLWHAHHIAILKSKVSHRRSTTDPVGEVSPHGGGSGSGGGCPIHCRVSSEPLACPHQIPVNMPILSHSMKAKKCPLVLPYAFGGGWGADKPSMVGNSPSRESNWLFC